MKIRFLLFHTYCALLAPLLRSQTNALRYITDLAEGSTRFGVAYAMNAHGDVDGNTDFQAFASIAVSATETTHQASAPSINVRGIVNGASNESGPLAPGSIASIYGNFLLSSSKIAHGNPWPTILSGLSVQFDNNVFAPLYFVSDGQSTIQIPWELAGHTHASLTATINGQTSSAQTIDLAPSAPGIFSTNSQGAGQGAILDSTYRLVDRSNPAVAGRTYIQIYCTGLGEVTNPPKTGFAAPTAGPLSKTLFMPTVTIGGFNAPVSFSGLAPGFVGVYQVNAKVPQGVAAATAVPVVVSMGNMVSNAVTIAVGPLVLNPLPSIGTLSPRSAPTGSGPLTLTINGAGFVPASSVTFNGSPHDVSFISGTRLTMTLSVSDLANAGRYAVIVTNPPPGGGASDSLPFTVTSSGLVQVMGAWRGSWSSNVYIGGGTLGTDLVQSGSSLTGSVAFNGSPCFTGGSISGTMNGSSLSATLNVGGGQTLSLNATVNPEDTTISGDYALHGGKCVPDDSGTFSITLAGPIETSFSGSWQGTWWESNTVVSGSISANLTQNQNSLSGTVQLSGFSCFSVGTVLGNVAGNVVSATLDFGAGQTITVTAIGVTTLIDGVYTLQGGMCLQGDSGTVSLSRSL